VLIGGVAMLTLSLFLGHSLFPSANEEVSKSSRFRYSSTIPNGVSNAVKLSEGFG
jgi:hypothetical protein